MAARMPLLAAMLTMAALLSAMVAAGSYIEEEFQPPARPPSERPMPDEPFPPRPPPPHYAARHVPELAAYLDRIEVGRALVCGRLAVYPLMLRGGAWLGGRWMTLDAAMTGGILTVTEREGGGEVPVVVMRNRSRVEHVFVMSGEVVAGGKQTRTIRQDVILAPGQQAEVPVFCVEPHRWQGQADFAPGAVLVPQSIRRQMRAGAGQDAVWAEVARSNAALGASSPTGDVQAGLKSPAVRRDLDDVRRRIEPEIPRDAVGFVFADRHAAEGLGVELFGRSDLAGALLGKLIDAYAVDYLVSHRGDRSVGPADPETAHRMLGRLRRAGSFHVPTPGSGSGIRLGSDGLVGDGVTLGGDLVHFGCQVHDRWLPRPGPPPAPLPRPY